MKPPPVQHARRARCPCLPDLPSLPTRPHFRSFVARLVSRSSQVLALLMVPASLLQAAIYEVAQRHPQASDAAPGTTERPWKTIGRAAASVAPGDVVVIRGGVYRERVLVKTSGTAEAPIRFEAAPGEHVLVTGADRLTDWQRVDDSRSVYSLAWPHRFIPWNRSMTHPDDEYHRLIGRCEQVIVDGLLLRQVLGADQIAPGTFFADVTNQTLVLWDIGKPAATSWPSVVTPCWNAVASCGTGATASGSISATRTAPSANA